MKPNLEIRNFGEIPTVRDWLDQIKGPQTRRVYLGSFYYFVEWLKTQKGYENISPQIMVEMRKQDQKSDDPEVRNRFESLTKRYLVDISSQATWTQANKVKSVQSFFNSKYLELNFRRKSLGIRPRNKKEKTWPTAADVRLLMQKIEKHRNKAIVSIMFQSGLSPIDVTRLYYEDVMEKLDKEPPVYFRLLRRKTGSETRTCLHPDTIYFLKKMLEGRENIKPSDPLFIGHNNKRLESHTLLDVLRNIPGNRFSPKSFRDAFKHYLIRAKVDHGVAEWMMGHTPGIDGQYGIDEETIVNEYKRVMDDISINGQTVMQETNVLEELQQSMDQDKKRIAELEKELEEVKGWADMDKAAYEDLLNENKELRSQVKELDQRLRTIVLMLGL
jgi:site-specific recombinase XerD